MDLESTKTQLKRRPISAGLFVFFLAILSLSSCRSKSSTALENNNSIRALSYSSLRAEGGLGDQIQTHLKSHCSECSLDLRDSSGNASLLAFLRSLQQRKRLSDFDVVIGLDENEVAIAKKEGLIENDFAFSQSPVVFLANADEFPKDKWPKSWSQVHTLLAGKVAIQDPRLSSPGMVLLRTAFQMDFFDLENLKSLSARAYPSWSSSFQSFERHVHPVIWTYLSSEAYYRCQENENKNYRVIPLTEGYPLQREYVATITTNKATNKDKAIAALYQSFMSESFQQSIALSHWMFPSNSNIELPRCFQDVTQVKSFELPEISDSLELSRWRDSWSL